MNQRTENLDTKAIAHQKNQLNNQNASYPGQGRPVCYRQSWKSCRHYVKHMWRFFFDCQTADRTTMTQASAAALNACQYVYDHLPSDRDRDIIRTYFTCPPQTERETIERYCSDHNMQIGTAFKIVNRAWRLAAVRRGIADE